MPSLNTVFLWVVAIDAIVVIIAGLAAAALTLAGKELETWWKRVFPATAILVGTTVGAGVILAAGRWMFGG